MDKNKYLLLVSSLGVLVLLIVAAAQENFAREWRRIQGQAQTDEGAVAKALRQVVNPSLGVSDRCVSCHLAMTPGEQATGGLEALEPHPPVVHDPAEYGCTICHGGQGQATEKDAAHGDVEFWPDPMLPVRYSLAGCGSCHTALGVPARPVFNRARSAFQRLDCLACHRVDGRGGTIRPDGRGLEGPDLSVVGVRGYDRQWRQKHLRQAETAEEAAWETSFAPIGDEDRELLELYLRTRVGAGRLVEAKADFLGTGCLGCHRVSGVGGDEGPELTRGGEKDPGRLDFSHVPGDRSVENWLVEHLRSPAAVVVDSQMPVVALPPETIDSLTMYTFSLRRRELPESLLPQDRVRVVRFGEREFSSDGETIFLAFCSGCHGERGQGLQAPGVTTFPSIASPELHRLVSDEFLTEAIAKGRAGRRMPAWGEMEGGLRPDEIQAVVAHLRRLSRTAPTPDARPRRWVEGDVATGERLYAAACQGCHGVIGQGDEAPSLRDAVFLAGATDTFLVETIANGRQGAAMPAFAEPSTVHPNLSREEIESVVAFVRTWEKNQ